LSYFTFATFFVIAKNGNSCFECQILSKRARERERESERKSVYDRERVVVCVEEREIVCVYVCGVSVRGSV